MKKLKAVSEAVERQYSLVHWQTDGVDRRKKTRRRVAQLLLLQLHY